VENNENSLEEPETMSEEEWSGFLEGGKLETAEQTELLTQDVSRENDEERLAIQHENDEAEAAAIPRKKRPDAGPLEAMAAAIADGDVFGAGEALVEHVENQQWRSETVVMKRTGWISEPGSKERRAMWAEEVIRQVKGESHPQRAARLNERREQLFRSGPDLDVGTCCTGTGLELVTGQAMATKEVQRLEAQVTDGTAAPGVIVDQFYRHCFCPAGQNRERAAMEKTRHGMVGRVGGTVNVEHVRQESRRYGGDG
jgi:hypothetical protein